MPLSPAERSLNGRIAALKLHSRVDGTQHTEPARAAGPGRIDYWLNQVDPDHELADHERIRRAEHAKKAWYLELTKKSLAARAAKKAAR